MLAGFYLMTAFEQCFNMFGSQSGTTICSAQQILCYLTSAIPFSMIKIQLIIKLHKNKNFLILQKQVCLNQQIKQQIQSVKLNEMTQKYNLNSTDTFFFTNANMLSRGKSMDLRALTKEQKKKQIQFMYDQYNLFKYGKVLTSRPRISSVRKSLGAINSSRTNNLNPQIKKYKNSKQIFQQSKKLQQRLVSLKCDRISMFDKVKRYVNV